MGVAGRRESPASLPASSPLRAKAAASCGPLYLSAHADATGSYRVSGFAEDGTSLFDLPLPGAGPFVRCALRRKRCRAFHQAPRPLRPGSGPRAGHRRPTSGSAYRPTFLWARRLQPGRAAALYATEKRFRGRTRRHRHLRRGARVQAPGRASLPRHRTARDRAAALDGETLVVANGGIATHPDLPRVKLNLPTMAPSLCFVDRRSGALQAGTDARPRPASAQHPAIWLWPRTIRSRSPCSTRARRTTASLW